MTKSKKMLALVIALVVMLVAVSGTLIAVLVAGNQNAQSKVHVKYTSSDVNVKVEAKYYVGSTGTDMVDKSNSNAKSIELDANKTTGSLDQPISEVNLSKENNKIIYEYKFTNLSTTIPATIGQLVEDGSVVVPKDSNNNVKLTYTSSSTSLGAGATSNSTTLNTQGLPASSTRYVYVIVSIVELLNDVDFEGTFGWDLAKGTTASLDTTGSGNSIVNVNTSQTGIYNAAALQNIDLMIGVENQEPDIYPMIANKCFTGWYTDADLQTEAEFPMVVTADTKLYPKHLDATSGLTYSFNSSKNSYTIDGYTGSTASVVIADTFDDGSNGALPVESIGMNCFSNSKAITSVTMPDSIDVISGYTFSDCTNLVSIKLPKNLKSIQYHDFEGCTKLANVDLPNSLTELGYSVFSGCTSISSIKIPYGVTYIGGNAFGNCTSLTGEVIIPDSVTEIQNNAFYNCSITSVTIGSGVNKIDKQAFGNCSKLISAVFRGTSKWVLKISTTATSSSKITVFDTDYAANAKLLNYYWKDYIWNRE